MNQMAPWNQQPVPHNHEAEQAVLGCILHGAIGANEVDLSADHFVDPLHVKIWDICHQRAAAGAKNSPVLIKDFFENDGPVGSISIMDYLVRLSAIAATVFDLSAYIEVVREAASRRRLLEVSAKIQAIALDPQPGRSTASEIILAEAELIEIATKSVSGANGLKPIGPAAAEAVTEARQAQDNPGWIPGLSTGLHGFDQATGGLEPGDLVILAARPSMGKTSIVSQIALNVATAGGSVPFYSIEMKSRRVAARMISALARELGTRVPYKDARVGSLNGLQFREMERAAELLGRLPILVDDASNVTPAGIAAGFRALARRAQDIAPMRLGIVDHLGLVDPDNPEPNRTIELGRITKTFKQIAKDLNIPIIVLCQLSRAVESRESKRPDLRDLRQSGEIEENGDIIGFLYRSEYYLAKELRQARDRDTDIQAKLIERLVDAEGKAEILLEKSRNGEMTTIDLNCDIACSAFWDDAPAKPQGQEAINGI